MTKSVLLRAACAAFLASVATPALADVQAGITAWNRGDYKTAVDEWRQPAINGDPVAQYNIGKAYAAGRGVAQDQNVALDWFRRAADQGLVEAQDDYGLMLFRANRREEAMPWIERSAARGEPRAQYVLGTAYFNGDLEPKDWPKAYALMSRASSGGVPQASSSLAQMDQFMPVSDRQQGLAMASEMAQQEQRAQLALSSTAEPAPDAALKGVAPQPRPKVTTSTPMPTAKSSKPEKPGATYSPPGEKPDSGKIQTVQKVPDAKPAAKKPAPDTVRQAKAAPAPAPAREGKWQLQLGAFSSDTNAKTQWTRLSRKVSALSAFKPSYESAGKLTRLLTGPFKTKSEAMALCTKIKAGGGDCLARE